MAKRPTFPTIIDELFRVDLSIFRQWGLLKPNLKSEGVYNDASGGIYKGSIDFFLHLGECPYCTFSGKFKSVPFETTVQIESKRSNLSAKAPYCKGGKVYYFICPITGKRCRKLYSVNGRLGSAKAFDLFYRHQTLSKQQISVEALFGALDQLKKINEEIYSPGIRRSYNGQITRRYKRLLKERDRLDERVAKLTKVISEMYEAEYSMIETESGFTTFERMAVQ